VLQPSRESHRAPAVPCSSRPCAARSTWRFNARVCTGAPSGLVVMDMDSTLIRIEVIDELARHARRGARRWPGSPSAPWRARWTTTSSLRPARRAPEGARPSRCCRTSPPELPLNEGSRGRSSARFKRLGLSNRGHQRRVSRSRPRRSKRRLDLDLRLFRIPSRWWGGKLTGRVGRAPIVNGATQRPSCSRPSPQAEGVVLDQVIAVGDGANDLLMLERAGLGIAFHAKFQAGARPPTPPSAGAGPRRPFSTLLGISGRELLELEAEAI